MTNPEHELAVLAILRDQPSLYDTLRVRAVDFADGERRRVFTAIESLLQDGRGVDDLALVDAGAPMGVTAALSGVAVASANAGYYAGSIRELAKMRRLTELSRSVSKSAEDGHDSEYLVDKLEHLLIELSDETAGEWVWAKDVIGEAIDEIEEDVHAKGMRGLSCGFNSIDSYLGGMEGGDYIIIAARPSIGKTALALSMIWKMIDNAVKVGFFSCEMSRKQIGKRLLAMIGSLNLARIRQGLMTSSDFDSLNSAATRLYETTLALDDTPNISLTELRSKARQMRRHGIQCIFVDYLTLIKHGDTRMSRPERVGEISKQLKCLARELDIPVVALSQVNRDAEDKMPGLANLRQSGEIEEDADVVMFLHRERDSDETVCRIDKHRNGPVGDAELTFRRESVRYEDRGIV